DELAIEQPPTRAVSEADPEDPAARTRRVLVPHLSGGTTTRTQFIVDSTEDMGKYGQWGGRQTPRRCGKMWGILRGFILCVYLYDLCVFICVSQGPFTHPSRSDEGPRDTGWSTRPALSERTRLRGVRTSILSVGSQQLSPVTLNRRRLWSLLHQMCIRRSLLVALPCAVVAAVMEHADSQVGFLQSILPDDQTYSSFTFLLGFFLTFHTAHAYQRFWYGAQMIYTISGNFIDMTSLLLAFTRHSDGLEELRSEFKVTLIRLASLLFAVSIEEVTGHQNEEDEISDDYISDKRAIDPRGLDQSMLERALSARHRPQVVCQMIQNLIVDQISNGVLSIPAPILTRAFQEQSNAMIQFHEVRSCSEVPFPFPFVIREVLLIVHWVVTPFFMGYWCPGIASAAFYTLVVTLTLWSLHGISMELDNPFGRDSNDIAVQFLQEQLNQQLVTVLIESELGLPKDKLTSATLVDELLARFERSSGQSLPSSPGAAAREPPERVRGGGVADA
ncbi:unnamed protein product, partial [Prorocentrum cordatum]